MITLDAHSTLANPGPKPPIIYREMRDELERARRALGELGKSLKSISGDAAPPAVHKLRTAARKVEAIATALEQLEGKESRRLLKSIGPMRKAAGGVRDMDVLLTNTRRLARYSSADSVARLVEQLEIARRNKANDLRRALNRKRDAARDNLKDYSKLVRAEMQPGKHAAASNGHLSPTLDGIHSAAMNAVRELSAWPPLDAENIHAFRLKVKGLRYTLQLAGDAAPGLLETLGDVQRRIGDWHDWQQLNEIAREILDPERDAALLDRIGRTTGRRFDRALAAAGALRAKYLATPFIAGI